MNNQLNVQKLSYIIAETEIEEAITLFKLFTQCPIHPNDIKVLQNGQIKAPCGDGHMLVITLLDINPFGNERCLFYITQRIQ